MQIITNDPAYAPFDEDVRTVGMDDETGVNYRPSVTSWGVFERPKNISKAYSGGRVIAKDEPLETPEQTETRKKRVAKKLEKYRRTNTLNLSNEERREVEKALEEANEMLHVGSWEKAIEMLQPHQERINERSELGGKVIFCYAMCLDNAQRREEAQKQYKRVIGNQYGIVSKQAGRMLWGMTTASKTMKADLFDYESDRRKYTEEQLARWTNPKFVGTINEEDAKELNQQAITYAFGLIILPLTSFAAYVQLR